MCVGRCRRHVFVRAVVEYREVLLLRSPLRTSLRSVPWEEQSAGRRASAGKAVVELRAERWCDRLFRRRLCCFAIGFREERAERKAGKGLHEVCLPSAEGVTEPEGLVGDLPRE